MKIVAQDKKVIVNMDNIISTEVGKVNSKNEFAIIQVDTRGFDAPIAFYKTEERAKEVLQEIVSKYREFLKLEGGPAIIQGQMDVQPNIFNIPKVYYMPED